MGKRSNFKRRPQDAYDTPREAVLPLLPHLPHILHYWEPCAGRGDLIDALPFGCVAASDISPRVDPDKFPWVQTCDALSVSESALKTAGADYIITNPPWTREILHPMIEHFSALLPTWLLFDADWMHTKQSEPYMKWCHKIVSVGRVKWIPDSPHTGKDNVQWHLFDQGREGPTEFIGRQT